MRPILLAILITAIPAFAGTRLENRPDGQYVIVERVDSVGHVYGITEQKLDLDITGRRSRLSGGGGATVPVT